MANWKRTIKIKQFLDPETDPDVVAKQIGKMLTSKLSKDECEDDYEIEDIIYRFESEIFETNQEVDDALSDLYGWADRNLTWIG